MAIAFVGDIHGVVGDLKNRITKIEAMNASGSNITAIVQVGDYGWYPKLRQYFNTIESTIPIYWIDGNHEDHALLTEYTTVTEVAPNQFFVPRGTVLELDGKKIAFMGGAASVDKEYRLKSKMHWSEGENITPDEMARLDGVDTVDILVTHVPPQWVIEQHFDPLTLGMFGLPSTWKDLNAIMVEALWKRLGYPLIISGHMHKKVIGANYIILDIAEVYVKADVAR